MTEAVSSPADIDPGDPAIAMALGRWLQRGRPDAWCLGQSAETLLFWADLHGCSALLSVPEDMQDDIATTLRAGLRARRIARAMWEQNHRRIAAAALAALEAAGLTPIVMKGSALAWSIYPGPEARIRGDSDILIEETGRDTALRAMTVAGFDMALTAGGRVRIGERLFQMADPRGMPHDIDLHWRQNSSQVIGRAFCHAALLAGSEAIPRLAPTARRIGDEDALLIACYHRSLHTEAATTCHLNGRDFETPDRLIWLVDVDLLWRSMSADKRQVFAAAARARGLAAVCARTLRRSRDLLGTPVPDTILQALEAGGSGAIDRYLTAGFARRTVMNFLATRGLAGKAAFLRELALPDAEYMRDAFGKQGRGWLPALYVRRLVVRMAELVGKGAAS